MNRLLLSGLLILSSQMEAAIAVSLTPSAPSAAPLGITVTWTADASGGGDPLWYRFRVRRIGENFRVVRDYGPLNTLRWTASEHEGPYEVDVSVQNPTTGETAAAAVPYEFTSRVVSGSPVINVTGNPLVFLYSAPGCPAGSRMRVRFDSEDGVTQFTPYKSCRSDLSMNFYLAGLRTKSRYSVRQIVDTGSESRQGAALTIETPDVSIPMAGNSVILEPKKPVSNGILLRSALFQTTAATDLYGNLLWFYRENINSLTRPEPGGHFFALITPPTSNRSNHIVREFDLAGNTVAETNAGRINQQLAALGQRQIVGFHHEARRLRNGNIMVLAGTEEILTDVQGEGPVDVLGDTIIVLDRDLQVVWTWDSFDHLDVRREAPFGDTCGPTGEGCVYFSLAPRANDWLHGNSLQETPDGHILYSARSQDWLIKIDYGNGQGSGAVIWRLGKDGDFQTDSTDPNPWFSHQHDAQIEFGSTSTVIVFDNGNGRYEFDSEAHSRGQVWKLDEANRTATLVLNADLGGYSYALGAAQKLSNGNYHFGLGWLPGGLSQSVEVDPDGNLVYAIEASSQEYRTFRMLDMYTPGP